MTIELLRTLDAKQVLPMNRRIVAALALSGLAASLLALVLIASANVAYILLLYPGATRVADEQIHFNSIGRSSISLQGFYHTPDELIVVSHWYAARFQIDPASERYLIPTGNCIWLSQAKLTFRIERAVTALLCSEPHGTRIAVNESVHLYLWP